MNAKATLNIIKYDDLKKFLMNANKEEIIEYGKKDYERMQKILLY